MPRRKFTLCLPALLLSFLLSYPTFAQSGSAKTGAGAASGRVTLNGEPARGVAVMMQPQRQIYPPPPSTVQNAKTDENGRFRFTGVAAGSYFIAALAPGFSSSSDNGFGPRNKGVNVSEGENVEGVEIELKRGGVITGRVTDAQGRPLTDEAIELRAHRGASISGVVTVEGMNDPQLLRSLAYVSAWSDSQNPDRPSGAGASAKIGQHGGFRLSGLRPGEFHLNASGNGTSRKRLVMQRVEVAGQHVRGAIELREGQSISDARIVMVYGDGVVRGQLKFQSG